MILHIIFTNDPHTYTFHALDPKLDCHIMATIEVHIQTLEYTILAFGEKAMMLSLRKKVHLHKDALFHVEHLS